MNTYRNAQSSPHFVVYVVRHITHHFATRFALHPATGKPPIIGVVAVLALVLMTGCTLPAPIARAESEPSCEASAENAPTIPVIAVGEAGKATQWQIHQIELNAEQEDTNPYINVAVEAIFTGPDGKERVVHGFWNGGSDYLVRFTPTTPGKWRYAVSSQPADAGLTRTGSFMVSAAPADAKGFLRRDPQHPYSFVYDNGERHFMMGQTYYDLIRTACAGDRWQEGVVKSSEYGINKIRVFVHSLGFGQDHMHPDYYPAVYPFGDDDHDQINLDYWRKMDEVVAFFAKHDMMADLILFMRPYNTEDALAFGTQEQDERYVRYILARYAAFPNVIWCITNEWEYTGKEPAYWDAIGELVRSEDPWMRQGEALRPLSIHNATGGRNGGKFEFFESDWPVHATVQYGVRNRRFENGDEWANHSIVQNYGRNMPVVNDEYGYIGEPAPVKLTREQHRRALWAIAAGGGYGSVGDFRIFNDGPDRAFARVIMTGHWHDAPEYGDIKRLVDFWTRNEIAYWQMEPRNDLVADGANVYVLGSGQGFVVYAAAGGEFTLSLPDGMYSVRRFDPRSGEFGPVFEIKGGAAATLELPDARDWALHLSRAE